jgi:hypothetical protein
MEGGIVCLLVFAVETMALAPACWLCGSAPTDRAADVRSNWSEEMRGLNVEECVQ